MNTFKHKAVFSAVAEANRQPTPSQQQQSDASGGFNEVKALIEGQGRAWEEFKKTNDARLVALEKGQSTADLDAKLDKLGGELDKMSEGMQRIDDIEKRMNRPDFGAEKDRNYEAEVKQFQGMRKAFAVRSADAAMSVDEYKTYVSGFWNLIRTGTKDALTDAERKAMIAGDDSNGGYLLPPPTVGRIVKKVFELSPIRAIASVQQVSTDALEGLYDNDESSYGWVGEVAARTTTTTPTLGKYRIEVAEMYADPKCSQRLLDDAAVDHEAWLAAKVADKFSRVEGYAFINGTGVGQPRGFASYTMATTGDGSRTWGQIEKVKTTANGDFAASNPADKLFDLIQAFKTVYLQNARWVTTREVIAKVRKFKESTTNAYMWQPGLAQGTPDTLLGYPIVIAQDVPALATGSLSMWLGDWMEAYQIVDRFGIRTLRDPFTDKPYVHFYSTRRVGGGVVNFEALKAISFEA
jgi:HK97 family phage major capsid protein